MLCSTTNSIDGRVVVSYRGVVASEVIFGADLVRDFLAGVTDAVGGRSSSYEREFERARKTALDTLVKKAEALRADAIIGMHFDYQVLGEKNGMMMVAAFGTAVLLTKSDDEKKKDEERALEEQAMYFVTIGNGERGPFSLDQIRELLVSGRIDESASVRIDGGDRRKVIGEILRKNS